MQTYSFTAIAPFDWILYVCADDFWKFGMAPSLWLEKLQLLCFAAGLLQHMLAGCKQCQVNTTWEQTAAGRHLKRNSVLCQPTRFVFGVEKFRWPPHHHHHPEKSLSLCGDLLSDQSRGRTGHCCHWALIPKNTQNKKMMGKIEIFDFLWAQWPYPFVFLTVFLTRRVCLSALAPNSTFPD